MLAIKLFPSSPKLSPSHSPRIKESLQAAHVLGSGADLDLFCQITSYITLWYWPIATPLTLSMYQPLISTIDVLANAL